jgi:hypothetical protein
VQAGRVHLHAAEHDATEPHRPRSGEILALDEQRRLIFGNGRGIDRWLPRAIALRHQLHGGGDHKNESQNSVLG